MVSGSENGGFGAHFDGYDDIVRKTVWVSLGYGALVFPSHEHTVYLEPGDIIRFDARQFFHANTVRPDVDTLVDSLTYGEVQGGTGRYREVQGGTRRYREVQGGTQRY